MKEAHHKAGKKTYKYGMVIDLDKCTGCGACMVACMAENNISFRKDETDKLVSNFWMRVYKISNGSSFPDHDICYIPRPCMHCEGYDIHHHTPCVTVCPSTATDYNHETG
ncbi:MAG: 4Fe-4S dicluster domain-containing protein, partial [Desulfobacterales bacterium]|nr:4Fe-4S dicluster domain-containing protein [Desulfobacterales bacterium]